MKNFVIYRIFGEGLEYIGKTVSLQLRLYKHKSDANKPSLSEAAPVHRIMHAAGGFDKFQHEVLEEMYCTLAQALRREKELIQQRQPNGNIHWTDAVGRTHYTRPQAPRPRKPRARPPVVEPIEISTTVSMHDYKLQYNRAWRDQNGERQTTSLARWRAANPDYKKRWYAAKKRQQLFIDTWAELCAMDLYDDGHIEDGITCI